jgi:hypothetical protein
MQGSWPQVSVSELLSAWFAGLGRNARVCLLAGGVLTAVGTLFDLTLGEAGGTLPNGIVGFFVQYHLVEYVLSHEFGLRPEKRRYGSAIGSGLLATLGMFGGLILLIIPGLYLAARWSISTPLIVGEEYTAIDALKESWRRTQSSAWPIVGCFVVVGLLLVLVMVAFAGVLFVPSVEAAGEGSLIEALTANSLGGLFSVILAVLSTAIYGLIAKPEGALDDVFS